MIKHYSTGQHKTAQCNSIQVKTDHLNSSQKHIKSGQCISLHNIARQGITKQNKSKQFMAGQIKTTQTTAVHHTAVQYITKQYKTKQEE